LVHQHGGRFIVLGHQYDCRIFDDGDYDDNL